METQTTKMPFLMFALILCVVSSVNAFEISDSLNSTGGPQTHLYFENLNLKEPTGMLNKQGSIEVDQTVDVLVSGTVTDTYGEPLPGVTVSVEGNTTGSVTDLDGKFSISVPEGSTLIFSFIGFETQRIAVGDRSVIDVTLNEDLASLDEVVVVGYGTLQKKLLTGATAQVTRQRTSHGKWWLCMEPGSIPMPLPRTRSKSCPAAT